MSIRQLADQPTNVSIWFKICSFVVRSSVVAERRRDGLGGWQVITWCKPSSLNAGQDVRRELEFLVMLAMACELSVDGFGNGTGHGTRL
jgi:hypothetical protein